MYFHLNSSEKIIRNPFFFALANGFSGFSLSRITEFYCMTIWTEVMSRWSNLKAILLKVYFLLRNTYFKHRKCCINENAQQVGLYCLIHTCLSQSSVVIVVVLGGGWLQCIAVSSLYIHKPRQSIPAPFPLGQYWPAEIIN